MDDKKRTFSGENEPLRNITQLATELAALPENADFPKYVSKKLKDLTHATFVSFGIYHPESKQISICHIETENRVLNTFRKISGKDSSSVLSPVDDQTYEQMCKEGVGYRDTLTEVTFGAVSPLVSSAVQKILGLDHFIGIAYIYENNLYGTSVLGFRKKEPEPPKEFLTSAASLISVTLRRRNAEMERKKAEEGLRRIEEQIQYQANLLTNVSDAILATDREFIIRYWNSAAEKQYGWTASEVTGNHFMKFIQPQYIGDSRRTVLQKILQNGFWNGELLHNHRDGTLFPVQVTISEVRNTIGQIIGHICINRDITERKNAEKALKESEKKFRTVVEGATEIIFTTDENGNFTYSNPAGLISSGYSLDELKQKNYLDLILPEYRKKIGRNYVRQYLNMRENNYVEYPFYRKDNEIVWYGQNSTLLIENNKVTGFFLIARDITEKKQMLSDLYAAKEKAHESDRLKSAFLANMSHEIRTPMNGILGFSELLKEPDLPDSEKEKYIKIINRSSQQLLTIINDIVDISKIEAGQESLHPEEFDLNGMLDDVIGFFRPQADQKQIAVRRTACQPGVNHGILEDKTKLWQILVNLIGNAIKFTSAGSVELECAITGQNLVFKVRDTGIGIDQKHQEVIFNRFRQANTAGPGKYGGTGLGLSISRSYAEMMGGTISVESSPGNGSVFTVTIPYHPAKQAGGLPEEPGNEKKSEVPDLTAKVVLLVEDDMDSAVLIRRLLRHTGVALIHVKDGMEAVELCKNDPGIRMVLMDMAMPRLTGFEATKIIKSFRSDLPVIATTAYALSGDRERCLDAGCDDYLSKPIHKESLIAMVARYVGRGT